MAWAGDLNSLLYLIWIGFVFIYGSMQLCLGHGGDVSTSGRCIQEERKALLDLRTGMSGADRWLSSWNGQDCCRWRGVECNATTGHVEKLDLHYPYPYEHSPNKSEVNPSLLSLKHLIHLDLSWNNFDGASIPGFIGSLTKLEYLNLSNAFFGGTIPHQLGNLSNLLSLDLSSFEDSYSSPYVDDLGWLSTLKYLKHLDLSRVNVSRASNWIYVINMLPSLSVLRLSGASLSSIPDRLPHVNLTSLTTIDLSHNSISSAAIPGWLFSLSNLKYLDLGANQLHGEIPIAISNLNQLQFLHLWGNNLRGAIPNTIGSLKNLVNLDLSTNEIEGAIPESLGNLSKLTYLDLSNNEIYGPIPDTVGNLYQLDTLNVYNNSIGGAIPESIGNLSKLTFLDLSNNGIYGAIPSSLGNLCNLNGLDASYNRITGELAGFIEGLSRCSSNRLIKLDLSKNEINGPIPNRIEKLQSLWYLDLDSCWLNGSVPASLGKLSRLEYLYLGTNQLVGALTEETFANLTDLSILDISNNSITVNVSQDWLPPFQVEEIRMDSCDLGPKFPGWLRNQTNLSLLNISNSRISDAVPEWFWDLCNHDDTILLVSHNHIEGTLPSFIHCLFMDLSYNNFTGSLPTLGSMLQGLDLSYNSLSGPIPPSFISGSYLLFGLLLSNNKLNGSIPSSFCEHLTVEVINLANNDFSGPLPDCWANSSALEVIDFSDNHLSGSIPSVLGSLCNLKSLHLKNNNFYGTIPSTLQRCKELVTLDLSENSLSGIIPRWIGESLTSLRILSLRANKFDGIIPMELSFLTSLQVLDLSHNNLSGTLPPSFGNFSSLTKIANVSIPILHIDVSNSYTPGIPLKSQDVLSLYMDNLTINAKGQSLDFTTVLFLVTSIDLSDNNLSGEIPEKLTNLRGLHFLNLSDNHFSGHMPSNIGAMGQLESLDLSNNDLSGRIPSDISDLNFLSHLNLSHNNLSGRIPSGNQLKTLNDPSIYAGNPELCGLPLPVMCPGDAPSQGPVDEGREEDANEDEDENIWVFFGFAPGFVIGFWGLIGIMMMKRSRRIKYIQFIDRICNWLVKQ